MKYTVSLPGGEFEVDVDGADLLVDGEPVSAQLLLDRNTPTGLLRIGTRCYHLVIDRPKQALKGEYVLRIAGERFPVRAVDERTRHIEELVASASRHSPGPAPIVAPMPGLIVRIHVEVGQTIAAGQAVLAIEAMKMENELRAASGGVVRAVHVKPGRPVEKGTLLIEFD